MKKWLYKWLPIIFGCHCKEERTFHYKGTPFPICARCTGELVGMILALFSCFFFRIPFPIAIFIMIPMIIDGTIQRCTTYESNNVKRFVTGFLFGYGLVMVVAISGIWMYEKGYDLGKNLRE